MVEAVIECKCCHKFINTEDGVRVIKIKNDHLCEPCTKAILDLMNEIESTIKKTGAKPDKNGIVKVRLPL